MRFSSLYLTRILACVALISAYAGLAEAQNGTVPKNCGNPKDCNCVTQVQCDSSFRNCRGYVPKGNQDFTKDRECLAKAKQIQFTGDRFPCPGLKERIP